MRDSVVQDFPLPQAAAHHGRRVAAVVLAGALLLGAAAVVWWPTTPGPPQVATAQASVQIDGRITLAPGNEPVPAGAMVVVYAYAVEGSQVPLAVLRRPASALPLDFKLSDSLAPNPEHYPSQARQLVIGARLGSGGDTLAQVGDWLAASQAVAPGAHGVQLVLRPPPR